MEHGELCAMYKANKRWKSAAMARKTQRKFELVTPKAALH